jgi:hypothetical protein
MQEDKSRSIFAQANKADTNAILLVHEEHRVGSHLPLWAAGRQPGYEICMTTWFPLAFTHGAV